MALLFKSKADYDADVSRQAMDVCEHVITEMGAELHDDLIQKLSIIRLYLDRLDRSKADPVQTESLIVNMNADFNEVVQSVRRISRRLMPVKMEGESFTAGISILCQNMERPGSSTIHFESAGTESSLPEHAAIYLSRMAQELIHNAQKHSAAWHVWVRLNWASRSLSIEVEDDGTAFSKQTEFIESLKKKSNTLRMRALVIGATLSYTSGSKGLLTSIEYPFDGLNGG